MILEAVFHRGLPIFPHRDLLYCHQSTGVSVAFEESGYVVTEGEGVAVCVLLTGELEREALVDVSAVEGTASGT